MSKEYWRISVVLERCEEDEEGGVDVLYATDPTAITTRDTEEEARELESEIIATVKRDNKRKGI